MEPLLLLLVVTACAAPAPPATTVVDTADCPEVREIWNEWEPTDHDFDGVPSGVDVRAVLAERFPECFDVGERVMAEAMWRRAMRP